MKTKYIDYIEKISTREPTEKELVQMEKLMAYLKEQKRDITFLTPKSPDKKDKIKKFDEDMKHFREQLTASMGLPEALFEVNLPIQ